MVCRTFEIINDLRELVIFPNFNKHASSSCHDCGWRRHGNEEEECEENNIILKTHSTKINNWTKQNNNEGMVQVYEIFYEYRMYYVVMGRDLNMRVERDWIV